MNGNPNDVVFRVFCEVIEQMAFMFGEELETEAAEPVSEALCARMTFEGPMSGSMLLAVPDAMCPVLAENILGLEPDDEEVMEKARDALNEVLNVTCGNVLTSLAGEEPVFDLTVPEAATIDSDEWQALATDPNTVAVQVDEFPALLRISLNSSEK